MDLHDWYVGWAVVFGLFGVALAVAYVSEWWWVRAQRRAAEDAARWLRERVR